MPWSIKKGYGRCGTNEWAVVKDDGEVEGCHSTKAKANRQVAALYASEGTIKRRPGMSGLDRFIESVRSLLTAELRNNYELVPVQGSIARQEITAGESNPEVVQQEEIVERSVSIGTVFAKANYALREKLKASNEEWYYYSPVNIFYDEDGLYLIVSHDDGQMYRSQLDISQDGSVEIGDLVPVVEEHTPVTTDRNKLAVYRQKDGSYRIVMRAATAVLNRVAEIDSTELFDNMIKHSEEMGLYPSIDYYHLGKFGDKFEIGQIDFLARSGVVYIASGIIDEKKILGRKVIDALERGEDVFGCSIEYYPLQSSKERIGVGDGAVVEVYRDGVNTRIAVLPEEDAAAWFTSVVKEREMNMTRDQLREKLSNLFQDEQELEEFLSSVDATNDEVVNRKLVHREKEKDQEKTQQEDTGLVDEGSPSDDNSQPVVELDDDLVDVVVSRVAEKIGQAGDSSEKILRSIESLSAQMNGLMEAQKKNTERLQKIEDRQEQLEEDWGEDLSPGLEDHRRVRVTYRARENAKGAKEEQEHPDDYGSIAHRTLSNIPRLPQDN